MQHCYYCDCPQCREKQYRVKPKQVLQNSVRGVLRPDPAKLHTAKEALKQVLNLLEELADEPLCDCPRCAPEEWLGWSDDWRKNGFSKADYPCKLKPLCDCPKCAPELWEGGPWGHWLKDGKLIEPFSCKKFS